MMDEIKIFRAGIGLVALALLVMVFLLASLARAQEVSEDFPPGDDRIAPVAQGERAPFDGQLFDTETAIRWGFRLQRLRMQLGADVAMERSLCSAQTDLLATRLQLSQDRYDFSLGLMSQERDVLQNQVLTLTEAVAEAQDVPWYRTWTFGVVVGFVAATALAIATVAALDAL